MAFPTKAPMGYLKLLYQKVVQLCLLLYTQLCRLKDEPAYFIPQVLIISSLALHTPFIAVSGREKKYPVWKKMHRAALPIVLFQNVGLFLRSVLMLSLALHNDMKFVTSQGITIDLCAFVTLVLVFFVMCVVNWKVYVDTDAWVAWYNELNRTKIRFEERIIDGVPLLRLGRTEEIFRRLCFLAYAGLILFPVGITAAVITLRESPCLLPYQITWLARQITIASAGNFTLGHKATILWLLMDWYLLMTLAFKVMFVMIALAVSLFEATIMTKKLRYVDERWDEKAQFHVQIGMFVSMVNEYFGFAQPVLLTAILFAASSCNATGILLWPQLMVTYPLLEVAIAGLASIIVIAASGAMKGAEQLKAESAAFLDEYESHMSLIWRKRGEKVKRWIFKRKPMEVRAGRFMTMEEGFALTCMMQVLDQTVNLVFMADINVPCRLLALH